MQDYCAHGDYVGHVTTKLSDLRSFDFRLFGFIEMAQCNIREP